MELAMRLIKEARSAAGLTQAELADLAGTSQPTIAAYEAGRRVPNVSTLERLLRATGTTLVASRSSARRSGRLRQLLEQRRAEIVEIAARHHAHNVRVFGSVARGEETDNSDIDLLVDMDPGRSLVDEVRLRRELAKLLDVEVDVVTSGGLLERDEETILADAALTPDRERPMEAVLDGIEDAGDAAAELVRRGREAWDQDRLLRLVGEAVIGWIADAANRLPDEVKGAIPETPWDDIRDIRILVDHIYNRVDYDALWQTLSADVPDLLAGLRRWRSSPA